MASARSYSNLKPFPTGKSGNRGGRPKKAPDEPTRKDWQEFALESAGADKNGKAIPSRNDIVMRTHFLIATDRRRKDVMKAIAIWYERVYGRAPETIKVKGKIDTGDNPLTSFLMDLVEKARVDIEKHEAEEEDEEAEEEEAPPGE
jgi:hypothetical protein